MARAKDAYVPELIHPASVDEAAAELARLGDEGEPIAGATWVMLGPLHKRPTKMHYVAVAGLAELRALELNGATATIGAAVTHSQLADGIDGEGPLAALAHAAVGTPRAIANVATVAGNICARPYPAADIVAALLALDAQVDARIGDDASSVDLGEFMRGAPTPGSLVTRVRATAIGQAARSCYERLTIRASGEEAVASVALAVDVDGQTVREARVVFGAVEAQARRCREAEDALIGDALSADSAAAAGRVAAEELDVAEGPDAPVDYKRRVLPGLMKRAVARLAAGGEDA